MLISLGRSVKILRDGGVVAIPTDTVYGLAASMSNAIAVQKIFKIKGRPSSNPLVIQIADVSQAYEFIEIIPPGFEELIKKFWPGALTIVVPAKVELIPDIVRAGKMTAGFRIPNNTITCELLSEVGPLVVPSANLSNSPPATQPVEIEEIFGADFPILEGENVASGISSTVLEYYDDGWRILRQGAITSEEIASTILSR
jgi:L-threonylcarbamoyladenylate synthase